MFKKLIFFFCLILIGINGFSQEKKTTAAVLELGALEGISKGVTTILSNYLRNQIVTLGDFTIVTRENMEQVLQEQKFQLSGCTSQECMVQVGQLLGVRKIFAGSIGKVGKTYILEVKLIDVETGKIESAKIEECPKCEEDALINSIKNLAIKVAKPSLLKELVEEKKILPAEEKKGFEEEGFEEEHFKKKLLEKLEPIEITGFGSLFVDSFPRKGDVYLNNVLQGKTPIFFEEKEAGVYRLKLLAKNFQPYEGYIHIPMGYKEKVYIKTDKKLSKRIKGPGYAYETKIGIQLSLGDFLDFEGPTLGYSAGLIIYFPYLSLLAKYSFTNNPHYNAYGIGGAIFINDPFFPLDWARIKYGIAYTYIPKSPWNEWNEHLVQPFPLIDHSINKVSFLGGPEFFISSNLSFYFYGGMSVAYVDPPALKDTHSNWDETLEHWFFNADFNFGVNFYFIK